MKTPGCTQNHQGRIRSSTFRATPVTRLEFLGGPRYSADAVHSGSRDAWSLIFESSVVKDKRGAG